MHARRNCIVLAFAAAAAFATSDARVIADQPAPIPPVNDLPNPYRTVSGFFKLPAGREWGSTSAVDVDKDGKSIWVAERCGANSCLDSATNQIKNIPTILKFDTEGNLVKGFGEGMLIFPHGIHVDRDGNIWVTDGQDNAPRPARGGGAGTGVGTSGAAGGGSVGTTVGAAGDTRGGAGAGAGAASGQAQAGGRGATAAPQVQRANAAATKGHQVFKFSPDGKLLLTLGKPGGANEPDYFFQPNDVLVAPNGDIFVSEGHASTPGSTARVLKFDKTGQKLLKTWGKWGSGDGEFDQPHALAMDSRGRLFIGDRNNNRVQIFDQDGKFLDKWYQFSRPSGVYIDKNDIIYVADSESMSVSRNHQGWKRGIRIGSAKDGKVMSFIPDPDENATGTSAAEGVVVDAAGNVYGAEVGPRAVKKYVKK
jgi:sugar lactone lactonase YvrE